MAVLTNDTDRLVAFYQDVFEAKLDGVMEEERDGVRLTIINIGEDAELNVFEVRDNHEADRQSPMFGRGRLDHIGLRASSLEAFEDVRRRLLARGACDEFVTDFGQILSVFFRDPDGLEGEVCVRNPDAVAGVLNPPGTPAARYMSSGTQPRRPLE